MSNLAAFLRDYADRARAFPPRVERAREKGETVILLHGLGRTRLSLLLMEKVLRRAGYRVLNRTYRSTASTIADLAEEAVGGALAAANDGDVHFVTHSMGGILLRAWFATNEDDRARRAVLIAPPNQGSEIVDTLHEIGIAETALGPAGAALRAGPRGEPAQLPPLPLEHGVIAGTRSLNPLSSVFLPEPNDGKVSVSSTLSPAASDHIVLPVTHTLMMNDPMVLWQTARFLARGAFDHSARASRLSRDRTVLSLKG